MELNSFNGQIRKCIEVIVRYMQKKSPLFLVGILNFRQKKIYLITFLVTVTPSAVVI